MANHLTIHARITEAKDHLMLALLKGPKIDEAPEFVEEIQTAVFHATLAQAWLLAPQAMKEGKTIGKKRSRTAAPADDNGTPPPPPVAASRSSNL